MANTYSKIYIHAVFAVQDRMSLIQKEWKDELYKYISGIVKANKHKLIAINGPADHVHVFIGYLPHQTIPDLLQDIKGSSSKWINEKGFVNGIFRWQEGYSAFSYSHSQINDVVHYIKNQEEHHKSKSFHDEYKKLLKGFNIEFDEKYILKEIE